MLVLGLSAFYHDSAAALVRDGVVVAAAQEERFTRRKHDPAFPAHAIAACLRTAGVRLSDLDAVAFYDKPWLKFERLLETYVATAPHGLTSWLAAVPVWVKGKLWMERLIRREFAALAGANVGGSLGTLRDDLPLLYPEHHESHAASAFFPSPFERAAFLTIDGVGEWATTSYGVGDGAGLRIAAEQHFPHSLGLFYSAFTYVCGFRVNSGEYKLMGLAPYGTPRYVDALREHVIDVRDDGSVFLNLRLFRFATELRMTGPEMDGLFGPRREMEAPITPRDLDLAASVQAVTEDAVLKMARTVRRETGERVLTMAGGVALNCVANGRLVREGVFDDVWIQPAAGDAGGAVGAALLAAHRHGGVPRTPRTPDAMQGAFLGPDLDLDAAEALFAREGVPAKRLDDPDALADRVAALLAEGRTVGWAQGRMEFGPRALGHRSILADPRGRDTQRRVNLQVKFRESFRPFAPAVLAEHQAAWFDLAHPAADGETTGKPPPSEEAMGGGAPFGTRGPGRVAESPYMLLVGDVRGASASGEGLERRHHVESPLPAVTHVDGSARVQTVRADTNPVFHRLLTAFHRRTGVPVLVNTSFNVRGEPIVATAEDAYRCFRATHLDVLVVGPFVVEKRRIPGADAEVLTPEQVAATYGLD